MIAEVAVRLQAMQLEQARESLAAAAAQPAPSPAQPAAAPAAVLHLSAAAQALLVKP